MRGRSGGEEWRERSGGRGGEKEGGGKRGVKFVLGYMVCTQVWCVRNVSMECGMRRMRYCPTPHCPSLPVWGRVPRPYHSPRSQAACVSSCEPAVGPSSVWCPCCDCGRVGEGTRGEEIGEEEEGVGKDGGMGGVHANDYTLSDVLVPRPSIHMLTCLYTYALNTPSPQT